MKQWLTNAATIGGEFEFFKDHLVAIALEGCDTIRGLGEQEIRFVRITLYHVNRHS